jgi:AraC-like DNA-binding protein
MEARVRSWRVECLPGVECFEARDSSHHYGRHSHESYAIGVIDRGVGGNRVRGAVQHIPAGGVVAMNPEEPHTGYAAGSVPLSYRMLYVPADTFRWLLPESRAQPCFPDSCSLDPGWHARLGTLHRSFSETAQALEHQVQAVETLGAFAAAFGGTSTARRRPTREPRAVRLVKAYLRESHRSHVRLEHLARLTGLHRSYLIRAFRRHVGLPPHVYLIQVRVERAKQLLARGMPIAQVALEVGFVDQSHLTRRFKQITALTPKQFVCGHFCPSQTPTRAR